MIYCTKPLSEKNHKLFWSQKIADALSRFIQIRSQVFDECIT
jgi:hypothetical protein